MTTTPSRLLGLCFLLLTITQFTTAQSNTHYLDGTFDYPLCSIKTLQKDIYADTLWGRLSTDKIIDSKRLEQLNQAGIHILSYSGAYQYKAAIPCHIRANTLEKLGIKALSDQDASAKISKELTAYLAKAPSADTEVALLLHRPFSTPEWAFFLEQYQATNLQKIDRQGLIQIIRLPADEILRLASHPLIRYVYEKEPPVQTLNHENRCAQRTNVLQSSALHGLGLNGADVVIGIGDGGELGDHIDISCRTINYADGTYNSYGAHGDHVCGTIGSAGNLNPTARGMAPEATLLIQKTTNIIYETESYIQNHDMVITNNSYGVSSDCASNGSYNYSSINLDKQLRENEHLIHVFAAGNSGYDICDAYPQGYKTVLRYYGAAKNVLTVGAIDQERQIAGLSSRGPVADGRIKPEICAPGVDVLSTGRAYNYFTLSGTSMATPSVSGTLALLYERYRQLHHNANPLGALIKAIVCNTADDLGNPGPDFTYGYGALNAKRAANVLEKQHYTTLDIEHTEIQQFDIEVPEGLAQLKVMLYWHDIEAEPETTHALVNDLDLKVVNPSSIPLQPWVLDPHPNGVSFNATRTKDALNNIEQVSINHPQAGTYTIQVRGFQIPMGTQTCVVTYDFVEDHIELTHPFGAESFVPNSQEIIQWDAPSTNTTPFTIDYSLDNGVSWINIATQIPANVRQYPWTIPSAFSEKGIIRVQKTDGSDACQNQQNFCILAHPTNFNTESDCAGGVRLSWEAVNYPAYYEVYMLECDQMVSIGSTNATSFSVTHPFDTNTKYWFSVRAVTPTQHASIRTIAKPYTPSENDCTSDATTNITSVVHPSDDALPYTVYPNPFERQIHLRSKANNTPPNIQHIYDTMGRDWLRQARVSQQSDGITLQWEAAIPPGIYYVTTIEGNQTHHIPIVKM